MAGAGDGAVGRDETTAESAAIPSASGNLASKPVAHLLVYAEGRRLDGTLELTAGSGTPVPDAAPVSGGARTDVLATVVLREGRPVKVRTRTPVAYLGQVLYERGVIDENQLNASLLDVANRRVLQGHSLRVSGAVDDAALRAALAEQSLRKLLHLFSLPDTTDFAFYPGVDHLAGWGGDDVTPLDPFPVVWQGVREHPPWIHVQSLLARVESVACRLARDAELSRFRLTDDELALARHLETTPMGISEFAAVGLLPPIRAELLYYTLLITKQIATAGAAPVSVPPPSGRAPLPRSGQYAKAPTFGVRIAQASSVPPPPTADLPTPTTTRVEPYSTAPPSATTAVATPSAAPESPGPVSVGPASAGPVSVAPPSSVPPRYTPSGHLAPAPEMAVRRRAILTRASTIAHETYFEMLGIPETASTTEAQQAFFSQAQTWHPDRLPAALDDLREAASLVFAHLSEAHNVLSDEKRRKKYVERLGATTVANSSARPPAIPPANRHEAAEVAFSQREFERAEELLRQYLNDHPRNAPSLALLAWTLSQLPQNQGAGPVREQFRLLDQAIAADWECERAYHYRALLHKRVGAHAAALQDFKMAAQLNPHNVDAAREVRLAEMRAKNGSGPPSSQPVKAARPSNRPTISGLFERLWKR